MSDSENDPRRRAIYIGLTLVVAAAAAGVVALLLNIGERRAEARAPFVRLNEVTEDTTDPSVWGVNWPKQYDTYKLTALPTQTRFGGHGGSEAMPIQIANRLNDSRITAPRTIRANMNRAAWRTVTSPLGSGRSRVRATRASKSRSQMSL